MKYRLSKKSTLLLAGSILVIGAGSFVTEQIYPLWEKERTNRSQLVDLNGKIKRAQKVIASVEAIEKRSRETREALARMTQEHAMGPAVVWFPARLKEYLGRFGIADAQIRLNSTVPDPENEEFKRTFWNVQFPPQAGVQDMNAILLAVAAIEDREQFVRILDCSFASDPNDPHWPTGSFNISAMIRE